jgi:SAM-dependent methyltransferase
MTPLCDTYTGLIADWYDDWLSERKEDIAYYTEVFQGYSGSALELACGTGRLLLPLAQSGVAIEGLDSAPDMLAVLRKKAALLGLDDIRLYEQPMQEFDIPKTFDSIFIASGTFQLLTSYEQALACLRCAHRHLRDDGSLLIDIFVPWDDIRSGSSSSYRVVRDSTRADGSRAIVLERFEIDIPAQVNKGIYRYEFYKDSRLTDCFVKDLWVRWYWKDEFLKLLADAGFSNIQTLTDSSLYQEGHVYVFRARK